MAYYERGAICIDRLRIIKKYFKKEFFYDLIPTLILIFEFFIKEDYPILVYLYLLRISKYGDIKSKLTEDFHLIERFSIIT